MKPVFWLSEWQANVTKPVRSSFLTLRMTTNVMKPVQTSFYSQDDESEVNGNFNRASKTLEPVRVELELELGHHRVGRAAEISFAGTQTEAQTEREEEEAEAEQAKPETVSRDKCYKTFVCPCNAVNYIFIFK